MGHFLLLLHLHPELRYTQDNRAYVRVTLAVDRGISKEDKGIASYPSYSGSGLPSLGLLSKKVNSFTLTSVVYLVVPSWASQLPVHEIYIPSKEDESENLEFEEMMKDVLRFVRDDIDKMLGDDKNEQC